MTLVASYLEAAVFEASRQLASDFENRMTEYGALKAIADDTSRGLISGSEIQSLRVSKRRPVKTYALKKYTATSTPADSCSPSGDSSTSAPITLTFQERGFTIKHIPAIYGDNHIAAQQDIQHQMLQGFKAVFASLDTAALAFLESKKTGATPTSRFFTLDTGAYNYTGDPSKVYAYVPSFMKLMDMSGPYVSVADTEHEANLLITNSLGLQNSQNLAGIQNGSLAYSGQFGHYFTNRMNKGLNANKFYVFPQASTAIIDWSDPQYSQGMRISENDYFFQASDPLFGFQWEAHYTSGCADATETYAGLPPATKVENIWFGLKTSFVSAYSSTSETPIVSFTINEPVVPAP
jgi:hypothetical protein